MLSGQDCSRLIETADVEDAIASILQTGQRQPQEDELVLLWNGARLPADEVFRRAVSHKAGQGKVALPSASESVVTAALQRCGFTVIPKSRPLTGDLPTNLFEVLALQRQYSPLNTPAMARRGTLIRSDLPCNIRAHLAGIEPLFTAATFSCKVEGSDGKGRKNQSAWVRLFDPLMSPSPTTGWYVVIHFSRLGDVLYAGVGCGATVYKNGSFVALPDKTISDRIAWAKAAVSDIPFDRQRSTVQVKLHGNGLSRQFEKAMAFAFAYRADSFTEVDFLADLESLTRLLVRLYQLERLGRGPVAISAQDESLVEAIDVAVNAAKNRKGQGRGLTGPERRAVELRAMQVAYAGLERAGFTGIRDVSSSSSFDFIALKGGEERYIEVKGTTSSSADAFLLTHSELQLHREQRGRTVLALVSCIDLERHGMLPAANGGTLELLEPWDVDGWDFFPTAYRAERKM